MIFSEEGEMLQNYVIPSYVIFKIQNQAQMSKLN